MEAERRRLLTGGSNGHLNTLLASSSVLENLLLSSVLKAAVPPDSPLRAAFWFCFCCCCCFVLLSQTPCVTTVLSLLSPKRRCFLLVRMLIETTHMLMMRITVFPHWVLVKTAFSLKRGSFLCSCESTGGLLRIKFRFKLLVSHLTCAHVSEIGKTQSKCPDYSRVHVSKSAILRTIAGPNSGGVNSVPSQPSHLLPVTAPVLW